MNSDEHGLKNYNLVRLGRVERGKKKEGRPQYLQFNIDERGSITTG
jgi:hypothetical protein